MFALSSLAVLAVLGLATAAPAGTATTGNGVSKTTTLTGVTHSVIAGLAGLHFDPENIVAEIGDVVEVHFRPQNHSFAQSSFAEPCKPINDNAFFSGFLPTMDGENPNTFTITVTDKQPVWFYCAQTKGSHCQNGMAGVINQNFDGPNTLAAYKKAAALTGTSIAPPRVQGGVLGPKKNP